MATADFTIKQGDSLPVLTDTLTYSDGSSPNLAGATVQFVMRSQTYSAATVNAPATVTNTQNPASLSYTFTAAQTAVAGLFSGVWVVTFSGGSQMTWPTDGYIDIWVEENLTSDTSQYLVSLADVKDHLNILATDRTHDQKLIRWVTAARPVVESITTTAIPRVFDEYYDGGNYFIHLRHRPATVLLACSIYLGPVEYPLSIVQDPLHGSIYSCMLDPTGDRIVRRAPGGGVQPFPQMPDSVHAIYQAGPSTVPENVRMGTLEMIREHWVPTQQPGPRGGPGYAVAEEETASRETVEFLVSPRVREWLSASRRHPSVF